jgi:predicted metalloprotease with PDZ domain
MRYLNTEYAKKNRNYSDADFQKACETVAGSSFEEFFTRYVRGKDELPYNQIFAGVGLRLAQAGVAIGTPANEIPATVPVAALFGADLEETDGRLKIKAVRAGTPAYEQGLNANDEIVALNGQRVNKESFEERLSERRPGDTITLAVFRFDDLRMFEIKLGTRIDAPYRFEWLPQVTESQRKLLRDWLSLAK